MKILAEQHAKLQAQLSQLEKDASDEVGLDAPVACSVVGTVGSEVVLVAC